ncbi:hypothetical protein Hanom_Chr06g00565991 [Helianthus anomalus]
MHKIKLSLCVINFLLNSLIGANFFLNGKERRANHRDTRRCGQGRLLDRRQPLGSPRCVEIRPPPTQGHDSEIIDKTSLPI